MTGPTLTLVWLLAAFSAFASAAYLSLRASPNMIWSPIQTLGGQISINLAGLFLFLAALNHAVAQADLGMIVVDSLLAGLCLGFALFLALTGQPLKLRRAGGR